MLKATKQGDLVNENRTQGEAAGVNQAFSWDLAVTVEDALGRFVEVFDRPGA